jgi:hypothetical protein
MAEKNNDNANMTLQFLVASSVMLWATGYVLSVLWGIFWAVQNGNEPIEIIKAQYNWIGGAIFGYVAGLVSFGFPGSIGSAKDKDTINKLAEKSLVDSQNTTATTIDPSFEIPKVK